MACKYGVADYLLSGMILQVVIRRMIVIHLDYLKPLKKKLTAVAPEK